MNPTELTNNLSPLTPIDQSGKLASSSKIGKPGRMQKSENPKISQLFSSGQNRFEGESAGLRAIQRAVQQGVPISSAQRAEAANRFRELREELAPYSLRLSSGESIDLISAGPSVSRMDARSLLKILERYEDKTAEGGERRVFVSSHHNLANQRHIEKDGNLFIVVAELQLGEVHEVIEKLDEYRMLQALLSQAKVKEVGEKEVLGERVKQPSPHRDTSRAEATVDANAVKSMGFQGVDRALLEASRKQERKELAAERAKDEEHADIIREVIRKGVKKRGIDKQSDQYREKTS